MTMAKKKLFSVLRLKIGNSQFTLSDLSSLPIKEQLPQSTGDGTTHSTVVKKSSFGNEFISLYFEEGDTLPRPEVVYNVNNKKEENNPRHENQIERDTQTFVLIEEKTQKIYLSNLKKKKAVEDWLTTKLNKSVIIKNIIDQERFIDEIEQLNSIWLSASPNLFSSTGMLGEELDRDIHNFGIHIKSLGVSVKFGANDFPEKAKRKIKQLLFQNEKSPLEKLEISGRVDDKFERVFNMNSIVDRIEIEVSAEETGLFDENRVFTKLISEIQ